MFYIIINLTRCYILSIQSIITDTTRGVPPKHQPPEHEHQQFLRWPYGLSTECQPSQPPLTRHLGALTAFDWKSYPTTFTGSASFLSQLRRLPWISRRELVEESGTRQRLDWIELDNKPVPLTQLLKVSAWHRASGDGCGGRSILPKPIILIMIILLNNNFIGLGPTGNLEKRKGSSGFLPHSLFGWARM